MAFFLIKPMSFKPAQDLGNLWEVVIFNVAPPFPAGKDFSSLPQPEESQKVPSGL